MATTQEGRITNLGENQNGSIVNSSFIYDDAGRLVQVSRGGVVTNYDYDSNNNRLAKRVNGAVVESGSYDEQDRAVSYNGNAYTYNLNGELISKTKAGQSTAYEYDVYGNLKRVTLPSSAIIDYLIDGRGRRAAKKLNGAITQRFIYQSQLQVAAELTGAGSVRARFVYGSKMNVPDHMIMGGVTYKIVSDHLGSVRIVQRADNRQIVQEMTYDEFGRVLSDTNPGFQPFGFAGGIYDRDTGLVLFGARSYDSETGRWVSKDPIGFNGGDNNLYGYAFNDPINFIDPTGKWGFAGATVGFISGLVGGYAATGSVTAALIGGVVGAAVGFVAPYTSTTAGAAAANFVANILGQVAANYYDTGDPLHQFDPASPFFSMIGGSIGQSVGRCFGAAGRIGAAIEGGASGLTERGLNSIVGNQPIPLAPLTRGH